MSLVRISSLLFGFFIDFICSTLVLTAAHERGVMPEWLRDRARQKLAESVLIGDSKNMKKNARERTKGDRKNAKRTMRGEMQRGRVQEDWGKIKFI